MKFARHQKIAHGGLVIILLFFYLVSFTCLFSNCIIDDFNYPPDDDAFHSFTSNHDSRQVPSSDNDDTASRPERLLETRIDGNVTRLLPTSPLVERVRNYTWGRTLPEAGYHYYDTLYLIRKDPSNASRFFLAGASGVNPSVETFLMEMTRTATTSPGKDETVPSHGGDPDVVEQIATRDVASLFVPNLKNTHPFGLEVTSERLESDKGPHSTVIYVLTEARGYLDRRSRMQLHKVTENGTVEWTRRLMGDFWSYTRSANGQHCKEPDFLMSTRFVTVTASSILQGIVPR